MKKIVKLSFLGKIIYSLIFTILIITALSLTFLSFKFPGQLSFFTVDSGSMEPSIPLGSLIIIKPSNYKVGDIITFRSEKDLKQTTTHRIIRIEEKNNTNYFLTQGDANKSPDFLEIKESIVAGKVIVILPFVGYFIKFVRTEIGFILTIITPATLFIFNELMVIKNIIKEEIGKRNKRGRVSNRKYISPLFLILIFSLTIYSQIQISNSYFVEREVISNSFTVFIPPESSLLLREGGKIVSFTVKNTSLFKKVSYQLTYDSDSGPQGVNGNQQLNSENEFSRDITLGTCSTGGICVYHTNVTNIKLHIDLEDEDGNITSLDNSL